MAKKKTTKVKKGEKRQSWVVTTSQDREGVVEGLELEAIPGETWSLDRIRDVAGLGW